MEIINEGRAAQLTMKSKLNGLVENGKQGKKIGEESKTSKMADSMKVTITRTSGRSQPSETKAPNNSSGYCDVTVSPSGQSNVYKLSEVLTSMKPSSAAPAPPRQQINLEDLRLPPGITITKVWSLL